MARIEYNKEAGVEPLSGQYGKLVFRHQANGKNFVYRVAPVIAGKNATRAHRRVSKKHIVIEQCVEILQLQLPLSQEAIDLRKKIKERVEYLYEKYSPQIRGRIRLQARILKEYGPITDRG